VIALAGKWRGEPVGYVAEHLGVSERRARTVVASLVARGLVHVVDDPHIGRRVWTPSAHADWARAQRKAAQQVETARLHPPTRTAETAEAAR
jgi:predicted DNA-binding transcriptional regulator